MLCLTDFNFWELDERKIWFISRDFGFGDSVSGDLFTVRVRYDARLMRA